MRPQPLEGSSGVVRAAVRRRAGCQARNGVTSRSAIALSASDPALRWFQPGTHDRSCEDAVSSCLSVRGIVSSAAHNAPVLRRCPRRSSSLRCGRCRWTAPASPAPIAGTEERGCLGPAGPVIGGVVADQCVRDAGGAVRQCAGDDPAVFTAGLQFGSIGFRGGFGEPQTHTEIYQRSA
jgi:hypothetical protein